MTLLIMIDALRRASVDTINVVILNMDMLVKIEKQEAVSQLR